MTSTNFSTLPVDDDSSTASQNMSNRSECVKATQATRGLLCKVYSWVPQRGSSRGRSALKCEPYGARFRRCYGTNTILPEVRLSCNRLIWILPTNVAYTRGCQIHSSGTYRVKSTPDHLFGMRYPPALPTPVDDDGTTSSRNLPEW